MNVERLLENFWRLFDLVLSRRLMFAGLAIGGTASLMAYGLNSEQVAAFFLRLNAEIFERAEVFSKFVVAFFGMLLRGLG